MFTDMTVLTSIGLTESYNGLELDDIKPLSCTVLNMNFFNKLNDLQLLSDDAHSGGYLRGCYGEEIDGILVQDKLRQMCAKDNMGSKEGQEENNNILSNQDRKEFIFHLLKLISIGGAKCQSEDKFHVLKDAIKRFYKDLIQVQKDATGTIEICSSVYEIFIPGDSTAIFPYPRNAHNKCYVVISGQKITLVIKKFIPFW